MSDMKNPLASFHVEPMYDTDYTLAEVVAEARRCLNCKVPQCRKGCPIENDIPTFIHAVTEGDFGMAAEIVYNHSDLPAICGRVCPREKQCEGHCVLGKKGKHVEIGKIERFIADIAFEGAFLPNSVSKKNGRPRRRHRLRSGRHGSGPGTGQARL